MKHLRIIQAGYAGYTGPIGAYEFVDGVSTVPIHRHDRDRLCTAFDFNEINEDGTEERSGIAHRLVAEALISAPELPPSERQTEVEKALEDSLITRDANADRVIYDADDLLKIADKKGIAGLREVAAPWNVKHRSIPALIELIVEAQSAWLSQRQADFEARGLNEEAFLASLNRPKDAEPVVEPTEPVTAPAEPDDEFDTPVPDETKTPEDLAIEAAKAAAATGDLSAAISGE